MRDHKFEWDDDKNAANFKKHRVSFEHARLVFSDTLASGQMDDCFGCGEERFTITGLVLGTLLFVAYAERDDRVGIITARRATKHKQDDYFEQIR
jgi:uncharacterized protein